MRPVILSGRSPEERRQRLTQLQVEARELRAWMTHVKAEYEAGHLSLDEELALVREIDCELAAVTARVRDLTREQP